VQAAIRLPIILAQTFAYLILAGIEALAAISSIPWVVHSLHPRLRRESLRAVLSIMGAFEKGGRPPMGDTVLVGERGPELMVFDRPGHDPAE